MPVMREKFAIRVSMPSDCVIECRYHAGKMCNRSERTAEVLGESIGTELLRPISGNRSIVIGSRFRQFL